MESKKRENNLVPVLVAIVALISLSIWYHYLGDYAIKRVDAVLGVENSLKIDDIVIEKGFKDIGGIKMPEIKISYTTSKPSESYIQVDDIQSHLTISKTFSKTITLSRDFFGKTVEVKIYARDAEGKEAVMYRNISIPTNIDPVITILNS